MALIDMSNAAAAPPRKTATRRSAAPKVPEPATATGQAAVRATGLMGLGQMGQGLLLLTGQYADAAAIGQYWEGVSRELANLSTMPSGEWLAKPIDLAIQIGPYGALLGVLIPFGAQIAANHGWIDASRMGGNGVMPPEVLESQMRANVTTMRANAVREQQEALREAKAAEAAMNEEMARANGGSMTTPHPAPEG